MEEIKRKADIATVVGKYVKLVRGGKNLKGLCPFHNEKTPSFMVNQELGIYKCFGCFPAGQKVVVPGGLKSIEDVQKGDVVISGKGKNRRVLRKFIRPYKGEMVNVELYKYGVEVSMTADHKVFVINGAPYTNKYKNLSKRLKRYWLDKESYQSRLAKYFPIGEISARKLVKGQCLLCPIDREVVDVQTINLDIYRDKSAPRRGKTPNRIKLGISLDERFLRLAGLYIAEGSSHRAYIRFSFGNDEESLAKEVVKIADDLFNLKGSIYRRRSGKTGVEVTICHSYLANIFENLFGKGAANKRIPEVMMKLPLSKQAILLKAISEGDGTTGINNKSSKIYNSITTISHTLAIQLRGVILRLGDFPTLTHEEARIDRNNVNHRGVYRIQWMKGGGKYNHLYRDLDGTDYWILPIKSIRKEFFKGTVYNLMIEKDHSFLPQAFVVSNCGKGGDVFNFIEEIERVDFGEALQILAEMTGVKLEKDASFKKDPEREAMLQAHELAAEYYHYLLTQHEVGEVARRYLKGREIGEKIIKEFKIGFSLSEWDGLYKYLVNKKGFKAELLEKAGLLIKSGGVRGYYDRFRGRVMFPIADARGRVIAFAGRLIPELDDRKDSPKYINSPESPIFHKSQVLFGLSQAKRAIREKERVVVVEGELDMIRSFEAGVGETVAIKGSALTEDHVEILRRLTKNMILALDADAAGDAATKRGIDTAEREGMNIKIVRIEGGKDPDDIARENPKKWKEILGRAVDIYKFYLLSAIEKHGSGDLESKKKVAEEVLPVFARISNQVVQAHYVRELAGVLEVGEEVVVREMERVKKGGEGRLKDVLRTEEKAESRPRAELLAEEVLGVLFELAGRDVSAAEARLQGLTLSGSAGKVIGLWFKGKQTAPLEFIKSLPAELQKTAQEAFVKERDQSRLERDLIAAIDELETIRTREKMAELTAEIKKAEAEGEGKKLDKLQLEFASWSKRLKG